MHLSLVTSSCVPMGGVCVALCAALLGNLQSPRCVKGQEIEVTTDSEWPKSVAELLRQGLSKTDKDSLRIWRECYHELVEKGDDTCRVDLAMGLIYARGDRYEDMWRTLMKTAARQPGNTDVLRLLSWARLSDKQFIAGLKDINTMIAAKLMANANANPADLQLAIYFAGEAFGFAEVAIAEVQPSQQEKHQKLRSEVFGLLPETAKVEFSDAEDGMRSKVQQAIQETRDEQAEISEEQVNEKDAREQELTEQQGAVQAEAAVRQQQAVAIQQNAQVELAQIQAQAQPLFAQLASLERRLSNLLNDQSREKEDFDKKRFDPLIADVRGEISGVQANLQPLIVHYKRVEQTAMRQLSALGVRVQQLGRLHGANARRLRANDGKSANGLTATVSAELRKLTRLATYVPLDFEKEAEVVLGKARRGGLTLD